MEAFEDLVPYQRAFEEYLNEQKIAAGKPASLFTPVSYILSLSGKRIRPVLTLLSSHLFDDDFGKALPQAMAVEIFHNFSLMHDDIMDQAPTRRGQTSTHYKYGVNAAILSGDAMLIMSYQYLIRGMTEKQLSDTLPVFSEVALDICKGQQMDMDFEGMSVVRLDDYLEMIRKKTAVLLGLSMLLGAVVQKADPSSLRALRECGEAAGMAFQVHDDYLDAFGDSRLTGKQRGGDIIQNKKTYLWVQAIKLGGDRIARELAGLYSQPDIDPVFKVNRVLEIYHALGLESHCQGLQTQYTTQAVDALIRVKAPEASKQRIFDLMAMLLSRTY
jgi:geranylgeranyl diphosphate synthase, type II